MTPEHKIVILQSLVKDTLNLLHRLPQDVHAIKAEGFSNSRIVTTLACALFGIQFLVHSDNGPEFSKAVHDALYEFLGVEVSNSVSHFSQSRFNQTPSPPHFEKLGEAARILQRLHRIHLSISLCRNDDQLIQEFDQWTLTI
ncbi:hypothetical protein P9112_006657 [Eukaryota sp. TZLM1-RC]